MQEIQSRHFIKRVIARDQDQNEFEKDVYLEYVNQKPVLSFGWPCEYYFHRLEKYYPFQSGLVIDMMGRNHKGVPNVTVDSRDMNELIETARDLIQRLRLSEERC